MKVILIYIFSLFLFGCGEKNPAINISDVGINNIPINKLELLKENLQGYSWVESVASTEGEVFRILEVFDADELFLTFNMFEGRIYSVGVHSDKVVNSYGPRVGSVFTDVFGTAAYECFAGMEELSGSVICNVTNSQHLQYVFSVSWGGPDGELPPYSVLNSSMMTAIYWR